MKFLIFALMALNLHAKVVETESALQLDITSTEDAIKLYQMLNVPVDFGTLVTGKPHSYKLFQDKNKNFFLYCAELKKNDYQCVYSINKEIVGDNISIENDNFQIHIMLTEYDLTKRLFDSINQDPMMHGNYAIKVMSDELPSFGVSCMTDTSSYAEYQCDVRIFKEEIQ